MKAAIEGLDRLDASHLGHRLDGEAWGQVFARGTPGDHVQVRTCTLCGSTCQSDKCAGCGAVWIAPGRPTGLLFSAAAVVCGTAVGFLTNGVFGAAIGSWLAERAAETGSLHELMDVVNTYLSVTAGAAVLIAATYVYEHTVANGKWVKR
jgi:hypothetical protein